MSKNTVFVLLAIVLMLSGIVVVAVYGHVCEEGETYQIVKYEPYFTGKGQPAYRAVYGCK